MQKILDKICERLKEDSDLLGIILYGSYASCEDHQNSDIDLIAIYDYEIDQVKAFIMDGKPVQLLKRSYQKFYERLCKRTRNKPYSFHAKVLYDKKNTLPSLLKKAKEQANIEGPNPLSKDEVREKRVCLSQDIYTIEGLIENNQYEGATFLMHEVLVCAIDLYYDYNHLFKVSPKRLIDDLRNHDYDLGEACSLVILSNDIQSKLANLWMIRNKVLQLVGGEIVEYEINF